MARLRKLLIPTVCAIAALVVLLNLGFWQLDRLAWKESLIRQVEEGVGAAPVPAPGPRHWDTLDEHDDYRHVSVTGTFGDGDTFYYTALGEDAAGPVSGPGVMAYAPLRTDDGWTVLINRGFLPQSMAAEERQSVLVPPAGPQTLTGLLRLSEKPNWTTPDPDLAERLWFARDTDAMAASLGVDGDIAPYSIDLDAGFTPQAGLPQAGETVVRFKNDHLGYALTWFGLAATLVGVYLTFAASILWPRRPGAA